jgi:hypothetical protein
MMAKRVMKSNSQNMKMATMTKRKREWMPRRPRQLRLPRLASRPLNSREETLSFQNEDD